MATWSLGFILSNLSIQKSRLHCPPTAGSQPQWWTHCSPCPSPRWPSDLWMNWMNRMSPDNLSINLCQTSNLDSRQFSHLNKRFSVETTEKSQIMIIDSTFYEEYQHQCWRNKNPWQRSWQRYRGGVDPVLIPDLRQLLLVDLNVPHGHLQRVPLRIYQLLCRIQVK